ncbi:hypothetical protein COHA_006750 [Chlorella ohadii]|uniref:Uncharacterized protein n=1 Tax=Chlorella ohadii TaxID=2649997 RepID=A0AAD5DN99_9CHLO|nr:hypothetical protein COHA_006750 [Chlorella ohadii]
MATAASQPASSSWHWKETAWLVEGHKQPLYCGAFNHWSPLLADLVATVGSNRATIYRCLPDGGLQVVQCYIDRDASEEYFVCAWSVDEASGAPLLLLAGKKGLLLAVNALTGALEAQLEGHGSSINDIAVHPDRPNLVVTASRDQSLRMWNLRTRCCVLVFQGDGGHRNEVLTLSWKAEARQAPDDSQCGEAPGGDLGMLLSAGMDNQIKIWGLQPYARVVAASEEWVAGGPRVFPTSHVTMPLFSSERPHWNYVDCVRWLGDFVLSKSVDNTLVCWQPDTSTQQHSRDGDVKFVQELALEDCGSVWWLRFALDYWGSLLAIGTARGRVLVFDPNTVPSAPKARLKPRRSAGLKGDQRAPLVRQTAVSFDGSIIVACHDDGSLTRPIRAPPAMKPTTARAAVALLACYLLATGVSGRTMAPREEGPARTLKGIEVAGTAESTPVQTKGLADWLDAIGDTIFGTCTWGNCCGAGCDCSEGSDAKDRLDRACRAHDVCYGGEDWKDCDAICRCDRELAEKADEYAALDCSEIDYAYCEDMKAKAEPIAAAMWVKIGACNC